MFVNSIKETSICKTCFNSSYDSGENNVNSYFSLSLNALEPQFSINFVPIEKRAYISEIVSAVLDGGSMALCLPTPGTAQYISYLLSVVSFN